MNEAGVALLKGLIQSGIGQLAHQVTRDERVFKGFSAVNIVDSSQVSLPESCQGVFEGSGGSASAASAKIQVSYEYLSGTFNGISLGSGRQSDHTCAYPVDFAKAGSVTLFDLGYFNQALLAAIAAAKAFFVTRLNTQVALYLKVDDRKSTDILSYLEAQTATSGEIPVFLGAQTRLPVRLIFHRLTDAQIAEKRRRVRRNAQKKKQACSPARLRWSAWHVCVTNVPATRWSPHQILLVYRLRWQIELIFKLWKSQAKLTTIRYNRPDRILCLLYAHLLGLLIFHALIAPYRSQPDGFELSPVKAFRLLQRALPALIRKIAAGWQHLPFRLQRFVSKLFCFAQKSSRPKNPSTRQTLLRQGI
jgi:hypothetical protein